MHLETFWGHYGKMLTFVAPSSCDIGNLIPGHPFTSLKSSKLPSRKPSRRPRHLSSRTNSLPIQALSIASNEIPRRYLLRLALSAAIGGTLGITGGEKSAQALSKKRILAKAGPAFDLGHGIIARDLTVGKGNEPHDGDTVAIHYSLFYDDLEVESSRESSGLAARPVGFTFGTLEGPGAVLRGIEYGCEGKFESNCRIFLKRDERPISWLFRQVY